MKFGDTMGLQVLLLHVLCQSGIVFAGVNNVGRWGMAGQMLLLHVLPQFAASGSECTQAQMVSILGRCPLLTFAFLSDPCKPGVRSLGPDVRHPKTFCCG